MLNGIDCYNKLRLLLMPQIVNNLVAYLGGVRISTLFILLWPYLLLEKKN